MVTDRFPIHQAIFGDAKGAHNLLASSPGVSERVLSDLASKYTDRLLPAELSWKFYSCGFPLYGYYVITRTFPVQATRSGMVQTHAVLVPAEAVGDYSLRSLLDLLPNEVPTVPAILPVLTPTTLLRLENEEESPCPPGYPSVVRRVLAGDVPVWLGHEGFEEITCFLWRRLWADARVNVRFRVSADPNDLADFPATLVWTPNGLRRNWNNKHFVDQRSLSLESPSICEAYLMSLASGNQLGNLLQALRVLPKTVPELKRLEQYLILSDGETADSNRAAVRLLRVIAPDLDELKADKKSLLDRLAQKTINGSEEDVLGLRNLDVSGFESGDLTLQNAIASWLRLRISDASNATSFAREVLLADHRWKDIAMAALLQEFKSWSERHARLLWHWWTTDPSLVGPSDMLVSSHNDHVEDDLVSTLPSLVQGDLLESVVPLAVTHDWYLLHAAALAATSDLETTEKLKRQLQLEPDTGEQKGLRLLVGKIGGRELVHASRKLQDDRLFNLAGQAVAQSPRFMVDFEATDPAWQRIWSKSIEHGGELFAGLSQATLAAHTVMNALIDRRSVPLRLVERLATDPQSDLANFERRHSVWEVLPQAVLQDALRLTARIWLERFAADITYDSAPLENQLQDAIIATWRTHPESVTAKSIPALWVRFSAILHENDFLDWLARYKESLTQLEAVAIGRLVLQFRWNRVARTLVNDLRRGRSDLTPAVHECSSLLGFFDRAYVSLFATSTVITVDEWWAAWRELSGTLYPHGIEDNYIWSEAGGDISLVRLGSAREQWAMALTLLRNGGAARSITIEGLLHQMRNDFPNNFELRVLEDIYLTKLRAR